MPSQPALPPLLAPYLSSLPHTSLTLVSSILGATSNWLVLRFLHAALSTSSNQHAASELEDVRTDEKRKVVFVSFMRSFEFWKSEAKRLGLDLARLADKEQFAFIDGLSDLFYTPQVSSSSASAASPAGRGNSTPRTTLPLRSQPGPLPGRSLQSPAIASGGSGLAPRSQTELGVAKKLHFSGRGTAALDALESDIVSVMQQLKPSAEDGDELLLIVDQPDLLLATTGPSLGIGATEMAEWVAGLQQHAHATILTMAADSPLIHNVSVSRAGGHMPAPIETEHAGFAIGLAHRARSVMQLRTLETGVARDVSGVLRISAGGGWIAGKDENPEKEVLYYIQRDGGVRVFGRGES
ncbi:uncharacterized protein PFLUO_LOCUS672 [Penicillium psychrofluorescens]|uniref:uncharacterized protein n=1 Tax=Penicillium psychrofluorescens TaxID=3158075 RepID=UPI003CCDCEB4